MAESQNTKNSQQQQQSSSSSMQSQSSSSSSKDFFNLSKTCGDNCSIVILVIMILLTLIFFGILIYCKFFRKTQKGGKNIIVQVKAISINQSVLEHVRSLSEKNMKMGIKTKSQQQIYPHNESIQGDARTQIQLEQDYKNFLNNQALNNIANGKQMLDYDNSVQFFRESQQNYYYKDCQSQNNPDFQMQYNNQNIQHKPITVSQMQIRNDQHGFSNSQKTRFIKSEQGNYPIESQNIFPDNQRNNSSVSNKQLNNANKKSGLILNDYKNKSQNLQNLQIINNNPQTNTNPNLQIQNTEKINDKQFKYGKVRLASLNPQGIKHQMETVKEDQNELTSNTKAIEVNKKYRRKLNIQKQIQNDPSILDSSLNNSVQNPETSMQLNNSILNQLQFSCKNQNSKLLGDYLEEQQINM
ncbi:transmembrane protein, putative (macronuclear) [Tetrahymena thermophila SB210]|uniref:Transmembrane protein, putative n=1 Tax=Tetrahymena thermophila (strain SB210) TaxID=312017 RepID=Q23QM9_TETTS|nr:transmembrane protein, putative [Tetrahymena thermophila SB210]EAR98859.1 transmembrane protein, putative [Tetrahymena thermophila SB210]|eukprot:XP_001019104.1 transmembrane protein, putative [Tetrahymena thermophila SB210]